MYGFISNKVKVKSIPRNDWGKVVLRILNTT